MKHYRTLALALLMTSTYAFAQLAPGEGPTSLTLSVVEPSPVAFEIRFLAQLAVPPGFRISVSAKDMQNVRRLQPMPT